MNRKAKAIGWVESKAVLVQGYYLDGDDGQPNPERTYCLEHAAKLAKRLTQHTGTQYFHCEAWGGDDSIDWCGIKTCGVALTNGGLTDAGVRVTLGLQEENPLAFVADVDELALVARALVATSDELWDLWLSQVLRRRYKITKAQQLAFEAAWTAGQRELALDILARPRSRRRA